MSQITGFFIDPVAGIAETRTIENSLDSFYSLLGCDCIDIVDRLINRFPFSIICDDEGLLKDGCRISAIDIVGNPALVGSLFIVNYSAGPELESITSFGVKIVQQSVVHGAQIFNPRMGNAVICPVYYC